MKKIISIAATGKRLYVLLENGTLWGCTVSEDPSGEIAWEEMPHPEDDDEVEE